jgi:hypothetical protein
MKIYPLGSMDGMESENEIPSKLVDAASRNRHTLTVKTNKTIYHT